MVTGPLVVELTLVKCHRRLVVSLGKTSNTRLVWKKAEVFKINGDDDDDHLESQYRHSNYPPFEVLACGILFAMFKNLE